MQPARIEFQITEEHIRRAAEGQHPLALALREAGVSGVPEVRILNTIETDRTGRKIRTLSHSPPVTRWLRKWFQGKKMEPIGLILDLEKKRINSSPGIWRR